MINWKIPQPCPLNIAHRGARAQAPENTLEAADLAFRQGAHAWELDVALSQDGVPVVLHDDTLKRTTDVASFPEFASRAPFRVCDFTLDELKRLNAGNFYLKSDPFRQIVKRRIPVSVLAQYNRLAIPTLEEALRFTKDRDWAVNVEIKDHTGLDGDAVVTQKVIDIIQRMDMTDSVLLSSFQHRYLAESKKILPALATGVLAERRSPHDPLQLCRELHANAYHPDRRILDFSDISRLRDAGFGVNVWTIKSAKEAAPLLAAGVTGIITDFPADCAPLFSN